ncbi:MAG: amino acid adenylation domain-containing protein, partial [Sphaerospermopsis sp. SIO1G2]|nr:amino acid adenylation domain-containing protein [Sphaerospermopsis sp. SIO1G2]
MAKKLVEGEVLKRELSYWEKQLENAPALLSLPTDRQRPAVQSFVGANVEFTISGELTEKLVKLSQEQGVTLFMTLLATFQTLLYRYTGQTDILVGSPIANRDRHEIEDLIGFFINTLVMRGNLADNPQFQELLPQIREIAMEAYSHQNLPFEMLVEALQPERNLSYTPIFQVVFGLQNAPMSFTEWTGLNVTPEVIDSPTSKFDLSLLMENTGTEMVGVWEYSTDLFDRSTIERMMGHFITLLTAIVESPQTRINELPILTTTEKQRLLNSQNNIQEYGAEKCIHQLFTEQVEQTPDTVAVVFANQQLTYQELNNKANQVAHYLRSLGVGADVLVGIAVERSVEMLVGILGILKAGGAYVPLDPDYPRDRLEYMLSDSQVSILLTQEKCLESLPPHNAQVICLDRDWEDIATASQENPVINNTSANLAYIIYTSGSTGKPKGTLINHSNVVRLFAATDAWYQFNQNDVWTMFHSYAFDFSVWEIWGALLYGGKLVIVPYMVTRSPESFYELLSQERVTVLNQTPSAFRQLIQAEASTTAKKIHLRYVIFGGEALEIQSLQPWFAQHGDQVPQLVNMYGITETTVHVTYRPLSKADLNSPASVIGCPIPDLQVYVLDENLQPVPVGITGEMYVGGAGVARGYLNRPDLTEQRFIPNPFRAGTKLYRTGDLARFLANGELEYLGRIDNQVKLRGFRIELGEIEATLAAHPDIWEAVVVVREDEPGNKRLVAYVVSNTGITPSSAELRQFLGEQLPSYMIPSLFVSLQSLPLTSNGKIDRRALPAPDSARPELESVFIAPRTTEEQILAAIWSRVLDVAQVGIHDNFFALGGDSIRSIQVLSEAREKGLNLSVKQLFQHQTIAELVQALKAENQEIGKSQVTQPFSLISAADKQLLPDGLEDAYPLAMLQMGMVYHTEYNQEDSLYHEISSFHLKTTLNIQVLKAAINDLVNYHPILRTSFDLSNFSVPLQLVHQQVEVIFKVEDWTNLSYDNQEEALNNWFENEKKQSFDWIRPPLLRFFVHRRTSETFNLTFSCHHAILDGWSVSSLMTELFKRYLALLGEKVEDASPELSVKYRDFIALEQQAIASSQTQQYWQQNLQDSTFTKLPRWSDFSDKTESEAEIGVQQVSLNSDISNRLKQLAHSAAVPLKNVLLAAHLRVLNFLSGEADVVTGVVANGRPEESDGERILGLFLNTLPFRLQFWEGTWIDLVKQVFAQEQEILPHRRYPLSQIQNNLGNQSLFETAFNFTNFHVYEQVIGLDNLEILGGKFFDQTNITFLAQFSIEPGSSDITVNLEYNPRELCAAQIEQISNYYHAVLTAMAQNPESSYHLNSLISEQEKQQLLKDWNKTETAYPHELCLHQLFESQVEKTPAAIAVEFAGEKLTYQQLNNRANQLANHLISLGVGADIVVGICVQRSLEMIVGILAILKAGGAYLPLDPEYPIERLQFMVEDAKIPVLLTQTSLKSQFNQYQGHSICVDTDLSVTSQYSQANTNPQVKSQNLGYVIYTSGSTGKPKGVAMSQKALANLIFWHVDELKVTSGKRTLQFSPLSFDASFHEMFTAWHSGGTLVLITEEMRLDAVALLGFIEDNNIQRLFIPFVGLQQIAEVAVSRELFTSHLQEIITAGEQLQITPSIAQWLSKLTNNCTLHNHYGPSETHVVTTYTLSGDVETWPLLPPIGRPIANTQVYILDKQLQSVPVGVPGELYIGGIALADGYLNREELTAERFINNPFDENSRLYKTGDLVRYLPDGNIEFLGRVDNQVKIRGFRIELGEIEAILSQNADIQASCVMVREDNPGDKKLVAYIVANKTDRVNELRENLKARLPEYMIPNAIVYLDQLPLTPSGKVDRRALPAPDYSEIKSAYIAPRTPTEEILTTIWTQVLKIDKVGINDNFFELGGHSLLATQLVSRISTNFQIEIPLKNIFTAPTVEQLAKIIETTQQTKTPQTPIKPRTENQKIPLSYPQQRLWFIDKLEPNSASYNLPAALKIQGKLSIEALENSFQTIIKRHQTLRTNFQEIAGKPQQIIQQQIDWKLSIKNLENLEHQEQEKQIAAIIKNQTNKPFNLEKDNLIRAELIKITENLNILTLCMHHIISDGWSIGILVEELATIYNNQIKGKETELKPLPIQYADFATWQRNWLQGETLETQINYWSKQLEKAPKQLEIPTDRPRPAVQTFKGKYQQFKISKELSKQIEKLSQEQGVTLFMTLFAAYNTLLYRYTGQTDILVGTPIANRN